MYNLSRRTVVGGLAKAALFSAAAGSAFPLTTARAYSSEVLTRHDVSTPQGQAMLEKYAQALTTMMDSAQIPEAKPNSWLFQWYTHAVAGSTTMNAEINRVYASAAPDDPDHLLALATWNTCRAHGMTGIPQDSDDFLPWHRMYVFYHEQIIRSVLNDPDFTLPYWDYTTEGKRSIPEQFRMPDDPLFKVLFRDNRNPGVNDGDPIDLNAPGSINLDSLSQTSYQRVGIQLGFNAHLDRNLHGTIHVLTGNSGNMGSVSWAARDPVFWLHHGNIDRLWASWNNGGGTNPTGGWLTHSFIFADGNGANIGPVISDFVDTENISQGPYKYDRLEQVPLTAAMTVAAASNAPLTIATQAQPGPVALSGNDGVDVTLEPAAATMGALLGAAAEGAKVYVVLQNLQTNLQPGVLYNVFVRVGADATESKMVGTINFFGAETNSQTPMAMDQSSKYFSFDITDIALSAAAAATTPVVRIVPVGKAEDGAEPVVGTISLVRQ